MWSVTANVTKWPTAKGFDAMTATLRPEGTASESVDAMHHALAAVHSALVLLQIENLLEIELQPNLPGTTTEFPNWRQRLPVTAAELGDHPSVAAAAKGDGGARALTLGTAAPRQGPKGGATDCDRPTPIVWPGLPLF
jgi:4-alpha-glucanotransferase